MLALAFVAAVAGVGIFAAAKPSREVASAPSLVPGEAGTDASTPPDPTLSRPRHAGARALSVDDALRALDLVRPRPRPAIDFTLPSLDHGAWRLADQRGKVVLLNFWATWCPPCLEEMPAMERLWRRFRGQDFVLIAVSVDVDPAVVPPFLARHDVTFPVALDGQMEVTERYGVRALPSSFVIDRGGTLIGVAIGPRHWDSAPSHALVEAMARR